MRIKHTTEFILGGSTAEINDKPIIKIKAGTLDILILKLEAAIVCLVF